MNRPNSGSESQGPERDPGQEGDPRPEISPSQLRGAAGPPDVTAAYIPKDALSPAGAALGGSHAERRRYDFLDPPRGPGELGWVAHYRVRRLLGEGGMGLVFEAEDIDLLRRVALKVVRPELAGTALAAQRFTLEARAMAALKHDHIVTIYQVGQQRGVPFLAMEYLQGMSLDRWLERGHKPSLDLVLRLGREIAAALAAAHRRGLIHRDIKPANIWLEAPSAPGQDSRLRASANQEPRCADHQSWDDRRVAGVHGPGAGARRIRRRGVRPVQPRVRVVRALYPSIAVPGGDCDDRAGVASDGHTLSSW